MMHVSGHFVLPSRNWTDSEHSDVQVSQGRLMFPRHIADTQGVPANPEKSRAIGHFPTFSNQTELQIRFSLESSTQHWLARMNPFANCFKDTACYWGDV